MTGFEAVDPENVFVPLAFCRFPESRFASKCTSALRHVEKRAYSRFKIENMARNTTIGGAALGQNDGPSEESGEIYLREIPTFITPPAIAEKLNWAPSVQRNFLTRAGAFGIPGWVQEEDNVWISIFRLLRAPNGLSSFERIVHALDSKKRTLVKAVFNCARKLLSPDLPSPPRSGNDLLSGMITQKEWETASWLVWIRFETAFSTLTQYDYAWLTNVVEDNVEIKSLLGTYWTSRNWEGAPKSSGTTFQAEGTLAPVPVDAEAAWKARLDVLIDQLENSYVADDLTVTLSEAAVELDKLKRDWEAGVGIPARTKALEVLRRHLDAATPLLPINAPSTQGIIDALVSSKAHLQEIEAFSDSLSEQIVRLSLAERSEIEAKKAQELEDSEQADAAYTESRSIRRKAAAALLEFITTAVNPLSQGTSTGPLDPQVGPATATAFVHLEIESAFEEMTGDRAESEVESNDAPTSENTLPFAFTLPAEIPSMPETSAEEASTELDAIELIEKAPVGQFELDSRFIRHQ